MAITFNKGEKLRVTYVEAAPGGPNHMTTFVVVEDYEDGLLRATDGRVFNLRSVALLKVEPD